MANGFFSSLSLIHPFIYNSSVRVHSFIRSTLFLFSEGVLTIRLPASSWRVSWKHLITCTTRASCTEILRSAQTYGPWGGEGRGGGGGGGEAGRTQRELGRGFGRLNETPTLFKTQKCPQILRSAQTYGTLSGGLWSVHLHRSNTSFRSLVIRKLVFRFSARKSHAGQRRICKAGKKAIPFRVFGCYASQFECAHFKPLSLHS